MEILEERVRAADLHLLTGFIKEEGGQGLGGLTTEAVDEDDWEERRWLESVLVRSERGFLGLSSLRSASIVTCELPCQ